MLTTDLGRGGFEFTGPWGKSVASHITSHADDLAKYSDEGFGTMIIEGKRPDGSQMLPPMPYGYLSKMSDDDLQSILLYLRALPPLPDTNSAR